jgi:hypothetical protein
MLSFGTARPNFRGLFQKKKWELFGAEHGKKHIHAARLPVLPQKN